jgi:hypothetical protein
MKESKEQLDIYEQRLQEELKKLQECQSSNKLDSCMKCEKIIGCEVRADYVKAVYESMNKGASGGFEF